MDGKTWRGMTEDQRAEYMDRLKAAVARGDLDPRRIPLKSRRNHRELSTGYEWHYRYDPTGDRIMRFGPVLRGDLIVVPSDVMRFNRPLIEDLKRKGFIWHPDAYEWRRSTLRPYKGRIWTRRQWLIATRRLYFESWMEYEDTVPPDHPDLDEDTRWANDEWWASETPRPPAADPDEQLERFHETKAKAARLRDAILTGKELDAIIR